MDKPLLLGYGSSDFPSPPILCMRVSNRYVPPERSAVSPRDPHEGPL
jgi:hypothetical protein